MTRYLAIGAGVVLIAGILLFVATRGQGVAASEKPTSGSAASVATTGEPERTPIATLQPSLPSGTATPVVDTANAGSSADTSDYTIGGIRVRDHRPGPQRQLDVPPSIHPPGGREIPSRLTAVFMQKVRAVVTECAASVPREARETKPRIEGQAMIAIKSQQATITSVVLQPRDVTDAARESLRQCVEQRTIGATTSAGNQADLEGYAITLSVQLP